MFVEVVGVGKDRGNIRIGMVEANACHDLKSSFGVGADGLVDGIAVVKVFVDVCQTAVGVIIGVDQYKGDAEGEFEQKKNS